MEYERISRREFLQGVGLALGTFSVIGAGYTGFRLYPFATGLDSSDRGLVTPENLEGLLNVSVSSQFASYENGKKRIFEVSFNRVEAARALYHIAQKVLSSEEIAKVHEMLLIKPLKIDIRPEVYRHYTVRGTWMQNFGTYQDYLLGGPRIQYLGSMVLSYWQDQSSEDNSFHKWVDQQVIHELVHFVQDIKDPFRMRREIGTGYNPQRIVSSFGLVGEPFIEELPFEVEAARIADEVVEELQSENLSATNASPPYGRFFNFTEV
jgi:hypothetical protein